MLRKEFTVRFILTYDQKHIFHIFLFKSIFSNSMFSEDRREYHASTRDTNTDTNIEMTITSLEMRTQ